MIDRATRDARDAEIGVLEQTQDDEAPAADRAWAWKGRRCSSPRDEDGSGVSGSRQAPLPPPPVRGLELGGSDKHQP